MSPVIQQGIIQLIYSTFLHNSDAIAFFVGIVLTVFLLFIRPSRILLFFLLAFVSLLIRFEYVKHIVDPLQEQTVGVVITEDGHQRTRRGFDLLFNDVVPVGLYFVGWGSMFMGVILAGLAGGRSGERGGDDNHDTCDACKVCKSRDDNSVGSGKNA